LDENQDVYFEQVYFDPIIDLEFAKNEKVVCVGIPEDIVTEEYSTAGAADGHADRTFNMIVQPALDASGKQIIREIPTEKEIEDWFPLKDETGYNVPGLMELHSAKKVAEYVMMLLGSGDIGVTYYDPKTRTLLMARYVAIHASLMLDNPGLGFIGTETDSAAFTSVVIPKAHALFNRSLDGFFLRKVTESTTNIYQRKISETPSDKEKSDQIPGLVKQWSGRREER